MRVVLMAVLLAGCADDSVPVGMEIPDACGGTVTFVPKARSPHVDVNSPITWSSNPPTSGPHYPVWAGYNRDYASLQRGYWVHDLEHGGVVFAYRCDAGCPDIAMQLDEVVRALPEDPLCAAPVRQRALVVADPLLPADGTVVAVAWGVYYEGTCVDAESLARFYKQHAGHGPENLCGDGAALGGVPVN